VQNASVCNKSLVFASAHLKKMLLFTATSNLDCIYSKNMNLYWIKPHSSWSFLKPNKMWSPYLGHSNFLYGILKPEFSVKISSQKRVHWRYCVKTKTVSFTLISYSYFEKPISGDCEVDIVPPPNVLQYVRSPFDRYLTEMVYWQS